MSEQAKTEEWTPTCGECMNVGKKHPARDTLYECIEGIWIAGYPTSAESYVAGSCSRFLPRDPSKAKCGNCYWWIETTDQGDGVCPRLDTLEQHGFHKTSNSPACENWRWRRSLVAPEVK